MDSVVDRVPASLLAALADLMNWLEGMKMPSMIIGGVAASMLGRPRMTRDVDALAIIPESDWAKAASAAAAHGILPRIENCLDFALRSRVLLMRHSESGIDIDLTLGRLTLEQAAMPDMLEDFEKLVARRAAIP